MKSIAIFLMALSAPFTQVLAQTTLNEAVRDGTGKPLPFVSVALLNARDSSVAKGTASDQPHSKNQIPDHRVIISINILTMSTVRHTVECNQLVMFLPKSVSLPTWTIDRLDEQLNSFFHYKPFSIMKICLRFPKAKDELTIQMVCIDIPQIDPRGRKPRDPGPVELPTDGWIMSEQIGAKQARDLSILATVHELVGHLSPQIQRSLEAPVSQAFKAIELPKFATLSFEAQTQKESE